jgi:hypothetical protein
MLPLIGHLCYIGAAYWRSNAKKEVWKQMILGLPSPLTCPTSTALQLLYDKLLNCFELCTKRTPRKAGSAAWEKFLTLEEFQELSRAKESVDEVEIALEVTITRPLVEVRIMSPLYFKNICHNLESSKFSIDSK